MDTVYLLSSCSIERRDNTIIARSKSGQVSKIPIENVRHIVAIGSCELNQAAACFLGKSGKRLTFLDYYGNCSAIMEGFAGYDAGKVHLHQAKCILDFPRRLEVAKLIIEGGLGNIVSNLKYYIYRGKSELKDLVQQIDGHLASAKKAESIEELMGSEGLARQVYYRAWKIIDPKLEIGSRTRQPPRDEINCLISFCNGLVYSLCANEIRKTQMDAVLSFLHSPNQARMSLALDLAEIFKPIISDRLVIKFIRSGMVSDNCFEKKEGAVWLNDVGRRVVLEEYRRKVDTTKVGEANSYRELVLQEAFKLQAHILNIANYSPFKSRI